MVVITSVNVEKYLSFSSGYMEGYFQFNVPERVLSAINCMFAMMAFREIKKYIEKDNFVLMSDKLFSK